MAITSNDVFTGLWTNWAKGNVFGATITVPSGTGAILTAILAIFVQLAANHIWNLASYIIHRVRDTEMECYGIVRQQQVILKNTSSPLATAFRITQLAWAWRSRRPVSIWLWSSLAIILPALLCASAGILAGIFSSFVISTSDIEVLLKSANCGMWDTQNPFTEGQANQNVAASNVFAAEGIIAGEAYARQCYNASSLKDCNTFSVPTIDWTTDFLAACPFDESMCVGPAMAMDTGPINSNHVLGLNFADHDQITVRKLTTCAPLVQDGFVTFYNESGVNYALYEYGPTVGLFNASYTWPINLETLNLVSAYTAAAMAYWSDASYQNDFDPIPALNRSDGDGTLFFLSSNALQFPEPCDDPVFAAHTPDPGVSFNNETFFLADNPAGVFGCLEQYQICNPAAPGSSTLCSPLTGIFGSTDTEAINLGLTAIQDAIVQLLFESIAFWDVTMTINAASSPPNLLAQSRITASSQFSLPPNQWQVELQNWHAAVLSALQERLAMHVTGPSDRSAQQFVIPPEDDAASSVCRAQRVRVGQDFNNVSMFGLLFVLIGGTLIILTSICLDFIVGCIVRVTRSTRVAKAQESWFSDDVLQIQRVAYKGQTFWSWYGESAGRMPVPEEGCLLGRLEEPLSMKNRRDFVGTSSVYLSDRTRP